MSIKSMKDLDLGGKTVVVREDLNVPMKDGKISNDKRISFADNNGLAAEVQIFHRFDGHSFSPCMRGQEKAACTLCRPLRTAAECRLRRLERLPPEPAGRPGMPI